MIEEELLKRQLRKGSREALEKAYRKYGDYLLTLCMALLHDKNEAEDVLHDVFVKFAESSIRFRIRGNLKSFLSTCAVNRARDCIRKRKRKLLDIEPVRTNAIDPSEVLLKNEQVRHVYTAMESLCHEQREVIVLRIKGGLKFREIASALDESIHTVQSRYRYGMSKLKTLLNGEVDHEI